MPECEDESEDKESDAYKIKRQQFSLQVPLTGCLNKAVALAF